MTVSPVLQLTFPLPNPHLAEIQATDALLIGQLDATYAAVHSPGSKLSGGAIADPLIITTPNADYLPSINLSQQTVVSRRDARWGPEDWTQWPQWYFGEFHHFPYVLRRPLKQEMPTHPLRRIWWDMTQADFVEEAGCGLTGVGRLRDSIVDEFYDLRSALMTEVSLQDGSRSPDDFRQLHEAAAAMRMSISTLRHVIQTFHNVLFSVTAAQRFYLETRAILDKMRKFDPRISTGTKHDVDLSIIGTVTDRPSLVYELFYKGVPVWFVRRAGMIPRTINIIDQVTVTNPHPSLGVILQRWPGAPVFYSGPRSPGMYFATNQWRPGSIDLSSVNPENWIVTSHEDPVVAPATSSSSQPLSSQAPTQSASSAPSRAKKPCMCFHL